MAELGFKEPFPSQWWGVAAPKSAPAAVIARANTELGNIVKMPDVVERFNSLGIFAEHTTPERMLEVVIEVDRRPLSSFGCDGVVMSTPTGSTAYSFSAGGPVVWPAVEALLLVPLSAHALFARPLVVGPDSSLAIEVLQRTEAAAVIWCDGRRMFELPPGARVIVRRSPIPVRLARLHQAPFTDRLVNKFQLPVTQGDIADALGLSAVHVNRTLKRLRTQELISISGQSVTIVNGEGLGTVAGFDPTYLHFREEAPD